MAATLTKAELADMLFEQVGLNKREAKDRSSVGGIPGSLVGWLGYFELTQEYPCLLSMC